MNIRKVIMKSVRNRRHREELERMTIEEVQQLAAHIKAMNEKKNKQGEKPNAE